MTYTPGIDTSTHQDNALTPQRIDWSKPAPMGVDFVINRAVYVTAKDDDFDFNWNGQRGKYLRSAYAFLGYWPGAAAVTAQAQALVNLLKPDPGEFPVWWLDMEKASSAYPELPDRAQLLPMLESYIKTAEDGLGLGAGLYTNFAGLLKLQPVPAWLYEKPLWLAWPLSPTTGETTEAFIARTRIVPPLKNLWGGKTFTLWQYSWKGPGLAMGMESHGLDMDYFNGTEAELRQWCGVTPLPPPADTAALVAEVAALTAQVKSLEAWKAQVLAWLVQAPKF